MGADIRQAYLEIRKAGETRHPPEFLEYLFRLVFRSSIKGERFEHLNAPDLCAAFQDQVQSDFGELAGMVLDRWGVRTFGDLGRAVFLLAEHGCFTLRAEESLEEYAAAGPIRIE